MPAMKPLSLQIAPIAYADVYGRGNAAYGYWASTCGALGPNRRPTNASYCCSFRSVRSWANVRPSSWLDPLITGTRLKRPEAIASAGATGNSRPAEGIVLGWAPAVAASRSCGDFARRQAAAVAA